MKRWRRFLPKPESAAGTVATVVTGTGTALAAYYGGPEAAIASQGAISAMQQPLESLLLKAGRLATGREIDIFARASEEFGGPVDELLRVLGESPKNQELLIEALEAARTAVLTEKKLALARTIAEGAKAAGDADIDLLYVRALSELSSSEIAVINRIKEPQNRTTNVGMRLGYSDSDLAELLPDVAPVLGPALAHLDSLGLIVERNDPPETLGVSGPDNHTWSLTQHGRIILERMRPDK